MSLKPDDLKTVENYKKAIKQDGMKINAEGKTKFWVFKDIELPTAGGGKQKLPALISLVDDTAVKAVLKGKQPVCRGTVGLKDGKVAFEAEQGKVPYATMAKAVPMLLGKAVHVPAGADVDRDDDESAAAPAAPPAPPAPSAAASPKPGAQGARPASGAPYEGIVKYRRALVEFAQAKTQVQGQIGALKSAIVKAMPDEGQFANDLAAELQELNEELGAAVDEAMGAAENESSPATDAVKMKIQKYLTEISSSSLVKQADGNPLGVPVTIAKTLGGALGRIREAMPAGR